VKSKVKWIIEECSFPLASKAASACGLIKERNEESHESFREGIFV